MSSSYYVIKTDGKVLLDKETCRRCVNEYEKCSFWDLDGDFDEFWKNGMVPCPQSVFPSSIREKPYDCKYELEHTVLSQDAE